ncbi:MAG: ergothioneine biosynthesis protein EgtB [Actinomycetota bacterium]|nr:ergothioneine biosynthesis protein EgtB [Actinomycetota bacterium]
MTTTHNPVDARERFCLVRSLTEELAAPLSAEDQTVQSMPDVSPTKWHRAHTTWFFEEFILGRFSPGYEPFHPAYRYLFNSYYEAVGPRHPRPERGLLSRPGVEEIAAYRRAVDAAMLELLCEPPDAPAAALVELGLHHEQQHQELLLMDIKHVLSLNPLWPAYRPQRRRTLGSPGALGWWEYEGGVVEIGHVGDGFAFDNETPRHVVHLRPFALASRPVTCGEWLAFMDDGGYRRAELWLSDGWASVQGEGWEAPLYWHRDGNDGWSLFTLGGERQADPAEPVCHVSYYEADAYARWSGARLPTEGEWEHAVAAETPRWHRFDLDGLHPRSVAVQSLGDSVGEVWEWTASPYLPYPGFRPLSGAVGEYNGKFMVNQHVLRGGACVTPPGHARLSYRNFFPPASRWPFAGIRTARDL